ncbi:signal peptidase I [Candidatus Poriferisodalis sp.]|uniref:signal peptidase I n=1 Tax=Candidatus Poriferisodalis sp. TaxID=3101277 RepID=UPI003B0277E7
MSAAQESGEPDMPDAELPQPRQPRIRRAMSGRMRSVLSWAWVLICAVLLAMVMRTFIIAAFYIPSASMSPALEIGDRLLVSKLSYRIGEPQAGDVVVFSTPASLRPSRTAELIKRVVAVGGETVEAHAGQLLVDGNPASEDYLPDGVRTSDFGPVLVPDGHVFVMGDNREASQDSRVFGTVPVSEIVGRAIARFWPPSRLGGL